MPGIKNSLNKFGDFNGSKGHVGEVSFFQLKKIVKSFNFEKVKHGESFRITYGRKKRAVAMTAPCFGTEYNKEREIGIYDGKVIVVFAEDFKMTEEELLATK